MKTRILCLSLFIVFAVVAEPIRLSEPSYENDKVETFGEVFKRKNAPLSLSQVMDNPQNYASQDFLVETEIAKVCQKKGCFFIAREGAVAVRVAFKDYGFFIPTDSSGKTVVLKGRLIEKAMNKQQADHFNKDVGDDTVFTAGKTYEIVASGITIPKSGV